MPSIKKPARQRQKTYFAEWRKFRGYSQEKVAEMMGMSRENYNKLENGKISYTQDSIELAAEAFNCEVGELLMRDPTNSQAMWSIWSNAKQEVRETIETVAKSIYENNVSMSPTQRTIDNTVEQSMRILHFKPEKGFENTIIRSPINNLSDKIWVFAVNDTFLAIDAIKVVGKSDEEVAKIVLNQYKDWPSKRDPSQKVAEPHPAKRLRKAKA